MTRAEQLDKTSMAHVADGAKRDRRRVEEGYFQAIVKAVHQVVPILTIGAISLVGLGPVERV